MVSKTSNKIICAVLTAALAVSPVFVTPVGASDGQDVETSASSWRYQDGDIIVEENLGECIEDESADPELLEDYNAQMGSSAKADAIEQEEPQAVEPEAEPQTEEAVEEPAEEPAEVAAEEAADEAVPESGDVQAKEPVEENLTAKAEEPVNLEAPAASEAPAAVEAPEQELSAKSNTARDRYWKWSGSTRGPGYLKGIDVSYWQHNINWAKVKASGVDFAILRCGYGANVTSKDDSTFAANVKGCRDNGIPYGVYIYSYANTVAKASDEADHAIRLLRANNCKLSYPIYYDLEDKTVSKASNATIVAMANTFCTKLRNSGYAAGVYASLSWWNGKLSGFSGYDKWVAQWSSSCTYGKDYSIWQCSSDAKVSGISTRVDANLLMCPRSRMDEYMAHCGVAYYFTAMDGKTYIVSSLGEYVKNRFFKLGSYTYALDPNGVVQRNQKYWIGSAAYILDSQGRAYINKSKTKKKATYYASPGKGKKGKLKKGKKFYVLRTSGKWSQMDNGYWIKTKYIKKTSIYPEFRPNVTVNYKAKLKKKTASRSGPSGSYIKKKTFKKNKTVTVVGTYGGWSKISSGQWLPSSKLKKK